MTEVIRESVVEQHLRARAETYGILCWKFTSPNRSGVPDRILIGTNLETREPHIVFAEVKRPGMKAEPHQQRIARQLGRAGATVFEVTTCEAADEVLNIVYAIPTLN